MPVPRTTWSNPSRSPSCWLECVPCCVAEPPLCRSWSVGGKSNRANRTATDTESGSVTPLSERESELLGFLCASPGQVFSRTQLLGRVFGSADTPGTVDTYVHYLRRKLGRNVVATVHGLGYRLGS